MPKNSNHTKKPPRHNDVASLHPECKCSSSYSWAYRPSYRRNRGRHAVQSAKKPETACRICQKDCAAWKCEDATGSLDQHYAKNGEFSRSVSWTEDSERREKIREREEECADPETPKNTIFSGYRWEHQELKQHSCYAIWYVSCLLVKRQLDSQMVKISPMRPDCGRFNKQVVASKHVCTYIEPKAPSESQRKVDLWIC